MNQEPEGFKRMKDKSRTKGMKDNSRTRRIKKNEKLFENQKKSSRKDYSRRRRRIKKNERLCKNSKDRRRWIKKNSFVTDSKMKNLWQKKKKKKSKTKSVWKSRIIEGLPSCYDSDGPDKICQKIAMSCNNKTMKITKNWRKISDWCPSSNIRRIETSDDQIAQARDQEEFYEAES